MESGYAQPWFYGMSQAFSISRNHPYTTQNLVALHTANGMLNKDADLTQGLLGGLLLITQLRVGVLLTLARLLRRDGNLLTTVIRFNAKIA
jgi:hypothetical protein